MARPTGSASLKSSAANRTSIIAFFGCDGESSAAAKTINRAGWRRRNHEGSWEYYATAEGFREMTSGFDQTLVVRALIERGLLLPDSAGKTARSLTVPGQGKIRLYHLSAATIAEGDAYA